MEKNWYILNKRILEMEQKKESAWDDSISKSEWIKKWNDLVEKSRQIAGCLNRQKYDQTGGKEEG